MAKGAPRGGKGRFRCFAMGRCGILCKFVVFSQENHIKMSKLLNTETAFFDHCGFESPQTKKTRQAILHLDEAFPGFLGSQLKILASKSRIYYRVLNVGSYLFVLFLRVVLERTSTSPETVVSVTFFARHSTTQITPQTGQTREK